MSATVYGTGTSEYDVLTRTDPGTPGGELMRRYWHPVALSEELPPGGAPVSLRIMGEDLVLFRDEDGQPGLLGIHCAHRGADLSYGRLEDGGLRCIYHGWLYDRTGRCLEQPGEPSPPPQPSPARGEGVRPFRDRIRQTAYLCVERSDAIWAYMGPSPAPEFPNYEFLTVPNAHAFALKLQSDCNWLQGSEGNIDLIHLSFLHYMTRGWRNADEEVLNSRGGAPHREAVEAEPRDYGLRVCKVTQLSDEEKLLYLCTYLVPAAFAFPGNAAGESGYSLNWHVPIDDTHHWKFTFIHNRDQPLDKPAVRAGRQALTSDYRSTRDASNRYLQDREEMTTRTFAGIGTVFQAQDLCVTEGAGPIQDRSFEHLSAQDASVLMSRRLLLKGIQDVQAGRDPQGVVRNPAKNRFPRLFTFERAIVPIDKDWREHFHEVDAGFEA